MTVVVCLASISPQTVGVIVRLEKEAFKVLTQHGKEVNAKPHALQLRKSRGVALDSRQVKIVVEALRASPIHTYLCPQHHPLFPTYNLEINFMPSPNTHTHTHKLLLWRMNMFLTSF